MRNKRQHRTLISCSPMMHLNLGRLHPITHSAGFMRGDTIKSSPHLLRTIASYSMTFSLTSGSFTNPYLTIGSILLQSDAKRLRRRFNELFSTTTGYDQLDRRIARTKEHADKLLLVLDFPEIPLHNNPAELGARQRVRKRIISFGPRTQDGLEAWDTFSTIAETAKKLGVSFYAYLYRPRL